MNMRRIIIAVLVVAALGETDQAQAGWPRGSHQTAPTVLNGTAGRGSWAGVAGIGPALPAAGKATHNPIIGSESRTGIFAHPTTGRTRYTGSMYDPTLGRFYRSSYRR